MHRPLVLFPLAALVACAATRPDQHGAPVMSTRPDIAAAAESSADTDAILEVVRAWNAAFARNDVEGYFAFVHPDVTVLTPGNPYRVEGLEQDRAEFRQGIESGRTRVHSFQMMQPRVQTHGDAAVVTYFWRGALGPDPKALAAFKETDVLVRGPEGWRLLHVHLSRACD